MPVDRLYFPPCNPSIYINSAHVFTANHITRLPTATLSTDQSNRSPGFLNFQLTETITWLWRWLPHRLSKRQSQTTVLLRTPIIQMIFSNRDTYQRLRKQPRKACKSLSSCWWFTRSSHVLPNTDIPREFNRILMRTVPFGNSRKGKKLFALVYRLGKLLAFYHTRQTLSLYNWPFWILF